MVTRRKFPGILCIALFFHIASVGLFLCGFLWQSTNFNSNSQIPVSNQSTQIPHPGNHDAASVGHVEKLVLFLIDSLPADFVFQDNSSLHFVTQELKYGNARGFLAKAQTPTVTLPRLKALTSGAIPNFIDVILNFGTQTTMKDNFINHLNATGKRIVFYGDDTWLRMFPDAFHRSLGVSSFVVSDYTNVDNEVTKNLAKELLNNDWDVMILHYLGLDHIGHLSGRHSHLVRPKLREMDTLIEAVANMLGKHGGRNLMIVLGDHGMTDSGSHGGGTADEIDTPMIFLSPIFSKNISSPPFATPPVINQIDLASTISILMNVPIPTDNVGVFILPVLHAFLTDADLQSGLCRLTRQLNTRLINSQHQLDFPNVQRIIDEFCHNNISASYQEIHEALEKVRVASSILSSSSSDSYGLVTMTLSLISLLGCLFVYSFQLSTSRPDQVSSVRSSNNKLAVGLMLFHTLCLASSSFIEEEHQLWYMWIPTAYLFLAVKLYFTRSIGGGGGLHVGKVMLLMLLHRILREWNRTGNKWQHLPDIGDWLREPVNYEALCALIFFTTLFVQPLFARYWLHILALLFALFFHCFKGLIICAQISYLMTATFIIQIFVESVWSGHKHVKNDHWLRIRSAFINIAFIIVRIHNLPFLVLMHCQEKLLSHVLKPCRLSTSQVAFVYFLHGWSAFFLLGNSNALSNVDVAAGFAGITFYCAPIHGLLMFLHMYIGPIFWLLSFINHVHSSLITYHLRLETISLLSMFRLIFLLGTYANAAGQRHHLFIWTVFAPKVLYESVHSIFSCWLSLLAVFL